MASFQYTIYSSFGATGQHGKPPVFMHSKTLFHLLKHDCLSFSPLKRFLYAPEVQFGPKEDTVIVKVSIIIQKGTDSLHHPPA